VIHSNGSNLFFCHDNYMEMNKNIIFRMLAGILFSVVCSLSAGRDNAFVSQNSSQQNAAIRTLRSLSDPASVFCFSTGLDLSDIYSIGQGLEAGEFGDASRALAGDVYMNCLRRGLLSPIYDLGRLSFLEFESTLASDKRNESRLWWTVGAALDEPRCQYALAMNFLTNPDDESLRYRTLSRSALRGFKPAQEALAGFFDEPQIALGADVRNHAGAWKLRINGFSAKGVESRLVEAREFLGVDEQTFGEIELALGEIEREIENIIVNQVEHFSRSPNAEMENVGIDGSISTGLSNVPIDVVLQFISDSYDSSVFLGIGKPYFVNLVGDDLSLGDSLDAISSQTRLRVVRTAGVIFVVDPEFY
jgi:hypothetical protein